MTEPTFKRPELEDKEIISSLKKLKAEAVKEHL